MVMIVLAASAELPLSGGATPPIMLMFEPHGSFFSTETHQPLTIDPQVFVQAAAAPAGVGPQNIMHAAGFAPARLAAPADTPLFTADGKPLNVTLGRWLEAGGRAQVEALGGSGDRVTVSFTGLVPGGVYSLFAVTFATSGNTFTPLDGTGRSTSSAALGTGTARATVMTPEHLTHANAIVLVYHSDGQTHGMSRGAPGLTAHHQLIARLP
jgi:hypothetical protein